MRSLRHYPLLHLVPGIRDYMYTVSLSHHDHKRGPFSLSAEQRTPDFLCCDAIGLVGCSGGMECLVDDDWTFCGSMIRVERPVEGALDFK